MNEAMMEKVIELAEGNPGAITVLAQLQSMPELIDYLLYETNKRGPDIWVLYKDMCHEDIEAFCMLITRAMRTAGSQGFEILAAEAMSETIDEEWANFGN